jgi:hypothetical protein
MMTTKKEALDNLDHVINDCDSFEEWDTNDANNFESMSTLLEQVREYIKQKP